MATDVESGREGGEPPRRANGGPPPRSGCHGGRPPPTSRRDALKTMAGALLVSVGPPRSIGDAGGVEGADVLVGDLDEIRPGTARAAKVHGLPVLVVNHGGTAIVLSAVCTHENCTVGWEPERERILCPCHGGAYDPEGNVLEGPPAPLLRLPIRMEGSKIYVVV